MKLIQKRILIQLILNVALLFTMVSPVKGSGFGIFVQGASALGQADAVVAHSDGPSSVFFNPAMINDLPGTQAELGTTLVFQKRDFQSNASGQETDMIDNYFFPSTAYLTHNLNEKVSLGFGFFSPFGLGTEWPDDWEGRSLATKSTITTYNFNPVISFRITPRLSIAGGIDFLYFDAELKRKIIVNPALPEIEQTFSGDDLGFGYNAGILLKVTDRINIGAAYRSEIDVDVKGDSKFHIPPVLSAAVPGVGSIFSNTGAQTDLSLPQQVFAGVSAQVNDAFIAEIGLRWEGWSSIEEIRFLLDDPVGVPPQTVEVLERDWHDTFSFMIGGKYRINKTLALLAGYLYGEDTIPDRTFEPSITDSPTHLFTIGADIDYLNFKLSTSYGYQLLNDRDKKTNFWGSTANGSYGGGIHLAAISMSYRF